MKGLIICGDHRRHLYFASQITRAFDDIQIIVMEREKVSDISLSKHVGKNRELIKKHFDLRDNKEKQFFSVPSMSVLEETCSLKKIKRQELNEKATKDYVKTLDIDLCVVFGADILDDEMLKILPFNSLNLHLGLSPWYRGAATIFWPFYCLQPQFAGVTFHRISSAVDGGDIVHQLVPKLEKGDTLHDVGAKCVLDATDAAISLIKLFEARGCFEYISQKTTGRIWRETDFDAVHLDMIYNVHNDKLVDLYLDGKLTDNQPSLVTAF